MALSYSDVNHLTDLARRVRELEERCERIEECVTSLQQGEADEALQRRINSLQGQINQMRGVRGMPAPGPDEAA